ncbi:MAG: hypothetical protein ACK48V_09715 [Crocinitomicaceae bacterium]|jgi:tetratricopeptide (TPR) repeat protein
MSSRNIDLKLLECDKALENDQVEAALDLLDEILEENPKCAAAHNTLGWIYKQKFSDREKAENHYKLAIQFDENYGYSYENYMFLLRDLGRLEDLGKLIEKAEKVSQVSKRTLFDEKGSYYELRGDYTKAIENYKEAIKMSLNNDNDDLKDHIKRCQTKINIFSRNRIIKAFRALLGFDDI